MSTRSDDPDVAVNPGRPSPGATAVLPDPVPSEPTEGGNHAVAGPLARVFAVVAAHPRLFMVASVVIAAVVFAVRLSRSPDFNIDETFYALAGQHVVNYDSVSFDALPVRVHPPLFFITVGGWLSLFGKDHAPVLDAIHAGRYLNVIFDAAVVGLTLLLGWLWTARRRAVDRGRLLVGAFLLVATDAFLLRFGRLLLIEPMAVATSLGSLAVAWALRRSRTAVYAPVVGATIGIALLVKEPALFLVAAPALGHALQREWKASGRHLMALLLGAIVWSAFPLWEASNGDWGPYWFTQTFSIRRLLGLLQVSGLNRKGASPLTAFSDTFWQYSGAYIVFAIGAGVLIVALWRGVVRAQGRPLDDGAAQLLGLGVLSYGFLGYSLVIGQSNEQLTVYSVPAAVLLTMAHPIVPRRPRPAQRRARGRLPVLPVVILASITLGVIGWARLFLLGTDDATAKVEQFLQERYPTCVPVNATGDPFHWYATLRTHPITAIASGPEALKLGVHVFLVSPKDAQFHYGSSSPELNAWVTSHGREVYSISSHTNQNISVWQVGQVPSVGNAKVADCVDPLPIPDPAHLAPATRFGLIAAGTLALDAVIGVWWIARRRRVDVRG